MDYEKALSDAYERGYNAGLKDNGGYAVLSEVRAVLEDIVEGEYRLFHSDSMDQDTGLEEDIRNLYKKVSEHFI